MSPRDINQEEDVVTKNSKEGWWIFGLASGEVTASTCVKYGDSVLLYALDVDGLPVLDAQSNGSTPPVSHPDKTWVDANNTWVVRSHYGDETLNQIDQRAGACVYETEKIYLQSKAGDYRWLSGARGSDPWSTVLTNGRITETNERTFQWIIRDKEGGDGTRSSDLTMFDSQCHDLLEQFHRTVEKNGVTEVCMLHL